SISNGDDMHRANYDFSFHRARPQNLPFPKIRRRATGVARKNAVLQGRFELEKVGGCAPGLKAETSGRGRGVAGKRERNPSHSGFLSGIRRLRPSKSAGK